MSAESHGSLIPSDALRDLTQLKRRAKELLRGYRQGDAVAAETVDRHFSGADPATFRLAQAQLVVARSIGFASWTRLVTAAGERGARPKRRDRRRPLDLNGPHYLYDVDPVDADRAWALFQACRDGDEQSVRSLLADEPQLIHAQNWYTQPIHFAVYANRPKIVRSLLEAGAEPGRCRFMYGGWDQLLERADRMGFGEVYAVLQATLRDRYGYAPEFTELRDAIKTRDADEVRRVLDVSPEMAAACDESGNNAVHWAIMTRQADLLPLVTSRGADPDHRRADGQTPAHVLINGDYNYRVSRELRGVTIPDRETMFAALFAVGAEPDLSVAGARGDRAGVASILEADPASATRLDSGRRNPLTYAARSGHLEIVRTLLGAGADPNQPEELAERGGALFAASAGGYVEIVALLLEHGADPNAGSDSSGVCLSITKVGAGDAASPVEALLRKHGATTPIWEMTVAQMAAALEHDEPVSRETDFGLEALARNDVGLARLLIERRPDIVGRLNGATLRLGSSDVAITESAVLKLLLAAGFDPNAAGWLGKTPLHHFAERGEVGNALLMIEHGADIDAIDDEFHGTPLAWAAARGQVESVRLLIQHGADPTLPVDPRSAVPIERARAEGHSAVVELLERLGTQSGNRLTERPPLTG